jgi:hypothetical protein
MTTLTCDRCGCELKFAGNGIYAPILEAAGSQSWIVHIVACKGNRDATDLCDKCLSQLAIVASGTANASDGGEPGAPEANTK